MAIPPRDEPHDDLFRADAISDALSALAQCHNCWRKTSERLINCIDVQKLRRFHIEEGHRGHRRCQTPYCLRCRDIAVEQNFFRLTRAILNISSSEKLASLLHVRFTSPWFALHDIGAALECRRAAWRRLLNRQSFLWVECGVVRSWFLDLSIEEGLARCVTKIMVAAKHSRALHSLDEWRSLWQQVLPGENEDEPLFRAFSLDDPLSQAGMFAAAYDLAKTHIDPSELLERDALHGYRCDPGKLRWIAETLSDRKMIYSAGVFAE